jgi:hypothetical protein
MAIEMCKLSFDEIKDGYQFEQLVAEYFRCLPKIEGTNVERVEVLSSGVGPDAEVDLVVHIHLHDGVQTVTRTYIIQCKFHKGNIHRGKIAKGNLAELINANKACGYVLICREMATNPLKEHFIKLGQSWPFIYSYHIWSGEEFLARLHEAPDKLIKQFFPIYFACSRQ